jgi:hypothetical protein
MAKSKPLAGASLPNDPNELVQMLTELGIEQSQILRRLSEIQEERNIVLAKLSVWVQLKSEGS